MFIRDLRYALRHVRRAPGFFACAALLITVGITANTPIFTLVNALLLRPLPVRDSQNLVQLFDIHPKLPPNPYYPYRFYEEFTRASSTLFGAVGQSESTVALEQGGRAGVQAMLGRVLDRGDSHTAVLSYAYWSRGFGRDPKAVGEKVRLQAFVHHRRSGVARIQWDYH